MSNSRTRRTMALLASAALLASLTAATVAAPASAKPTCQGQPATIVGTNVGEVIIGTSKNDVIVARGGHDIVRGGGGNDIICGNSGNDKLIGGPGADVLLGQNGRDKLFGSPGRDRLLGGPADDSFNGGTGDDACLQGSGTGPWVNCERPIPEPPTLVIAYSDVNNNQIHDVGDVMIAKIVDTNGDKVISPGDTIKVGKYPTSPTVITPAGVREAFEDWKVKTHTVASVSSGANERTVTTTTGGTHSWSRTAGSDMDSYYESNSAGDSAFQDDPVADNADVVLTELASPSQPASGLFLLGFGRGDDSFIDVIIYA
jgi:hemolysin type calcium-binding protein